MKNYKRLGDYIQLVDERNTALEELPLVGLSISKRFINSVANIIGTDLSNYKVIRNNQFACSLMQVSRDEKIPVAMYTGEKAIMSPAYPIFEVIDSSVLLPEYLMMWFSRSEFDRQASYYAVGGVRGNLPWEDFCDMQLPIPHITKQREIVKEYNVIQNRITLNQQLIQKLEETAQAVYREWFVEFEFPDINGKPYKSNGGEMVWNEELGKEIPKGWEIVNLDYFVHTTIGGDWGESEPNGSYDTEVRCIRGADIPSFKIGQLGDSPTRFIISKNAQSKSLSAGQIIIEISGGSPTQSTGRTVLILAEHLINTKTTLICSNFCRALLLKDSTYSAYIYSYINYLYDGDVLFNFENSTIGLKNFDISGFLSEQKAVLPSESVVKIHNNIYFKMTKAIFSYGKQNELLSNNHNMILSNLLLKK